MKTQTIVLALALLTSTQSNAQMAHASLFPEIKSTNPAVINQRFQEVITGTVSAEVITRKQKLETANGAAIDADAETKINVNSAGIFRGGKGGGVTTEFAFDYVMGSKTDQANSTSEDHSMKNTAKNHLVHLGVGLTDWFGLSVSQAGYKADMSFNETFAGQPVAASFTQKVNAVDLKAGLRQEFGSLALAGTYLHSTADVEISGGVTDRDTQKQQVVGAAIGTASPNFHVEAGYERDLKSDTDPVTGKKYTPSRITGTIEGNFGSFSLGYTGRYYLDGFFEIERVIFNQFVYENSYNEPRLDNTFNFSFGNSRGGTISASIYYSVLKSKEVNTFFQSGPEVDTTATSMGASLSYSYVF